MKACILSIILLSMPIFLCGQAADSSYAISQIDSLIKRNKALVLAKNYEEAQRTILMAKEAASQSLGTDHLLYAKCVFHYAKSLMPTGNYSQAEKAFMQARELMKNYGGTDHMDYARTLKQLGLLYFIQQQYVKADAQYTALKGVLERIQNTSNTGFAETLNMLGIINRKLARYETAEAFYLESLSIRETILAQTHPDYIGNLINLAILYKDMDQYESALEFFNKAEGIFSLDSALQNHPFYINLLINRGNLFRTLAQYKKAESQYLRAIGLIEQANGKEHPGYAGILLNLGSLYGLMGRHEQAEDFYLEAVYVFEEVLHMTDHHTYIKCIGNMGHWYQKLGQYEKAENLLLKHSALWKAHLGDTHPEYASSLIELGRFYSQSQVQHYTKAESLLLKVIEIYETKLDNKASSTYISALGKLGFVYGKTGQYEKAEKLILEAKNRAENLFGKGHTQYSSTLKNLGFLYQTRGRFEKALQLFEESKEIDQQILGTMHASYVENLFLIGSLKAQMGQFEAASQLFQEAAPIQKTLLLQASRFSSEHELAAYIQLFADRLDLIFSFSQWYKNHPSELAALCYDQALFYKGFLLHASNAFHQKVLSDSTAQEKFDLWKSIQRRLGNEYTLAKEAQTDLTELESKANALEKELVQSLSGFEAAVQQVSWKAVQRALAPGEAAVEFVHYPLGFGDEKDAVFYAAILLKANEAHPRFIPLFRQKNLKLAVESQKNQTAIGFANRGLKPRKRKNSPPDLLNWKPLTDELEGISRVYFAPSGLLHRLNLGAVFLDGQKIFADTYQLIQLNSTRQLVIAHPEKGYRSTAAIFGGIQYNIDSLNLDWAHPEQVSSNFPNAARDITFNPSDRSLKNDGWQYLEWTLKEVSQIHNLLKKAQVQTQLLTDYKASEEAFRQIGTFKPSPRVLHLATHGFFFPDPETSNSSWDRLSEPVFKLSDHPMIRSGLVLAGANHTWQGNAPLKNREDGILTAYEISQMDLSHTELVVLSACETGLGDIEGSEGVYGLQRAFKIAGAKYLIMSLWQVPDKETMIFMETFYQYWLEKKMTIPGAFSATQKSMKQKKIDPTAWAAFVLVE